MLRLGGALALLLLLLSEPTAAQMLQIPTRVFLNGVPTPVYFNDGDSFTVLAGRFNGTRARLAGFNTLESYGSVHQWGDWKAKELYNLAKLATLNARRGVWRCVSEDLARDGYNRILWACKDLAVDQVRRGYAHAMTVTLGPADPDVLAAQRLAIRERKGMWAHGIPAYVLTSLHSVDEGGGFSGRTYNRLVSSRDGHSAKWFHDDGYDECETICALERPVDPARVAAAAELLAADPEIGPLLDAAELGPAEVFNLVDDYARLGFFWGVDEDEGGARVLARLEALEAERHFGDASMRSGACGIYVEFERRFGPGRATCLD